ncbi:14.5 kDa bacteriolytic enzyme [Jimgerdemannia flammicorona]|uniref:14.5 kDa bacteriolytic enzyme n=1 Tax=Jimgerdemannia flammicorona TaxID=994334 RepID=A0A433DDX0_9FUNG|nr:14.5 kDa bacteriolytic enzyme [Jimgerdemannia flammicorona]
MSSMLLTCIPGVPICGGGPTGNGNAIVAKAKSQLGVAYSWGGGNQNGPSYGICCTTDSPQDGRKVFGFDCSGLSQYAVYQGTGKVIPQTSGAQATYSGCQKVNYGSRQPSDLVFYDGHVAIYAGNDQMVEAPLPGKTIRVAPVCGGHYSYGRQF